MKFTQPDISVYTEVGKDRNVTVNKAKFEHIAIEEAEAVWSDYNLASIEKKVKTFEDAYKEHDASGTYQLNNEDGDLRVIAHPIDQYPLDPAMENAEEPGAVLGEFDTLNERLIDAQDEVAERVTERIDEFVTID